MVGSWFCWFHGGTGGSIYLSILSFYAENTQEYTIEKGGSAHIFFNRDHCASLPLHVFGCDVRLAKFVTIREILAQS